jgi:hypothetical protein
MPRTVASLTDDSRGVIYDRKMFILQATEVLVKEKKQYLIKFLLRGGIKNHLTNFLKSFLTVFNP